MPEAALLIEADALPGRQMRLLAAALLAARGCTSAVCCCPAGRLQSSIECSAAATAYLLHNVVHLPAFQALLFHHLSHYLSLLLGLILCDTKYKLQVS